jgi:hypothetical protein
LHFRQAGQSRACSDAHQRSQPSAPPQSQKASETFSGCPRGGRIEWLLGVDGQAVIRVKHRYVKGGIVQAETSGISPVDSDS